jgi:adenosylcobyric acid synthase
MDSSSSVIGRSARGRAVMVCGTSSGAGKSFLATALCRWYARRGLRVAPFKAQNMSNNARVVAGGEIGSAQYFQALAARAVPDVRMNPVLLKPEADTRSQVVLLGQADAALSRTPWRERSPLLWPHVQRSLHALLAENDLVVIEGAGSPAEINLMASDIVNMRVAAEARAATLIVTDIDRGGAFAHLYGTHQLLPPAQRALIRGFVLNKFPGDAALLAPAPADLEALTGVPTLGVLPMWRDHGLPEEDGVFDAESLGPGDGSGQSIAIVAYPRISNLDEFAPLRRLPGVSVRWARRPDTVRTSDVLILPGSKHVAADLAWLRATGLDAAIGAHVAAGKPVLAICGGLQLLGHQLLDPHGVEGAGEGLRLLPYTTTYAAQKQTVRRRCTFGQLAGPWERLSGVSFDAYEIRHGVTAPLAGDASLRPVLDGGAGWQRGSVLAVYTHGLFEDASALSALFGAGVPTLEDTLEGLAGFVDEHLGAPALDALLEARTP